MYKKALTFTATAIAALCFGFQCLGGDVDAKLTLPKSPPNQFQARVRSIYIMFVTNRNLVLDPIDTDILNTDPSFYDRYFGYETSDGLFSAIAKVDVPTPRKAGDGDRASGLPDNPLESLVLIDVSNKSIGMSRNAADESFDAVLKRGLVKQTKPELIYVHGFRTSLTIGILNGVRLKIDTANDNTLVFCWPGDLNEAFEDPRFITGPIVSVAYMPIVYLHAQLEEQKSHQALSSFIAAVEKTARRPPNVLAHSMGAQLFLDAVFDLGEDRSAKLPNPINHVILAAPDVDASKFHPATGPWASHVENTLVFCNEDAALWASKWINNTGDRLGYCSEPPRKIDGATIKYAEDITGFIRHGYFINTVNILDQIKENTTK